jgi:hypothetical protein
MNKHIKKVVFRSAMERICTEFNRRTENLKVEFQQRDKNDDSNCDDNSNNNNNNNDDNNRKTTYNLHVMRLSEIDASVRNARQYCMAEIPDREQEAHAELVGNADESWPGSMPSASSSSLPIVPVIAIIGEEEPRSSYNYYDGEEILYPQVSIFLPSATLIPYYEASSSSGPMVAHGGDYVVVPTIQAPFL